jgi:hypothetical protein
MHAAIATHSPGRTANLLAGYLTEEEMSVETGKARRTLRQIRNQRTGPPWVKFGKTVLYPRDGFLAYLKSIEQSPRLRKARGVA